MTIEAKLQSGCKKEPKQYINRKMPNGQYAQYKVIHDPTLLAPEEWDRVVAVFALGQTWQFKGWPKLWSNPAELFQRVVGFHLILDNKEIDATIQSWNCHVLKV